MLIQNNTQNAYLVSLLKAFRAEFLDSNDIERMIGAKGPEEAWRVLNDTVYVKYFGETKNVRDFDLVLDSSLLEIKNLILKVFSKKKELSFLWLKYDFLNIKSLIKAKLSKEEPKLNSLGGIDLNDLRKVILEDDKKKLPHDLNILIGEVLEQYSKEENAQDIDFYLDREYLSLFTKEIKKIASKALTNFLRREIDLFNVKTYFRFQDQELKQEAFIPDGLISLEKFKIQDGDKLVESIADFHERGLIRRLKNEAEKEGVASLEREAQKILLDILSQMDRKIMGIEPVFAFWQAKVLETKLIHRILTLKNAGVATEKIHQLTGR